MATTQDLLASLTNAITTLTNLQQNPAPVNINIPAITAAVASASTVAKEKIKDIADPAPYDGKPEGLDAFFGQLELVFESAPIHYATTPHATRRILYTLTWMKEGPAKEWAEEYRQDRRERMNVIGFAEHTWDVFFKLIKDRFEDPHRQRKAQERLLALKMTGTAEEYFSKYQVDKRIANVGDSTHVMIVQQNLNTALVEKILSMETVPTSYDDWKKNAVRLDHAYRTAQNLRRGRFTEKKPEAKTSTASTSAQTSQNPRQNSWQNQNQRQTWQTKLTPSGATFTGTGIPMDIGQMRKTGTCFNCLKAEGHIAKDCPYPKRQRVVVRATNQNPQHEEGCCSSNPPCATPEPAITDPMAMIRALQAQIEELKKAKKDF